MTLHSALIWSPQQIDWHRGTALFPAGLLHSFPTRGIPCVILFQSLSSLNDFWRSENARRTKCTPVCLGLHSLVSSATQTRQGYYIRAVLRPMMMSLFSCSYFVSPQGSGPHFLSRPFRVARGALASPAIMRHHNRSFFSRRAAMLSA